MEESTKVFVVTIVRGNHQNIYAFTSRKKALEHVEDDIVAVHESDPSRLVEEICADMRKSLEPAEFITEFTDGKAEYPATYSIVVTPLW